MWLSFAARFHELDETGRLFSFLFLFVFLLTFVLVILREAFLVEDFEQRGHRRVVFTWVVVNFGIEKSLLALWHC